MANRDLDFWQREAAHCRDNMRLLREMNAPDWQFRVDSQNLGLAESVLRYHKEHGCLPEYARRD